MMSCCRCLHMEVDQYFSITTITTTITTCNKRDDEEILLSKPIQSTASIPATGRKYCYSLMKSTNNNFFRYCNNIIRFVVIVFVMMISISSIEVESAADVEQQQSVVDNNNNNNNNNIIDGSNNRMMTITKEEEEMMKYKGRNMIYIDNSLQESPNVAYYIQLANFGSTIDESIIINLMLPPEPDLDPFLCSYPTSLKEYNNNMNNNTIYTDYVEYFKQYYNLTATNNRTNSSNSTSNNCIKIDDDGDNIKYRNIPIGILVRRGNCTAEKKARILLEISERLQLQNLLKYIIIYEDDPINMNSLITFTYNISNSVPAPTELNEIGIAYLPYMYTTDISARMQQESMNLFPSPLAFLSPNNMNWQFLFRITGPNETLINNANDNINDNNRYTDGSTANTNGSNSSPTGYDPSYYLIRLVLFCLLLMSPFFRCFYLWYLGGGRILLRRNDRGWIVGLQYIPPMQYWLTGGRSPFLHDHINGGNGDPYGNSNNSRQLLTEDEFNSLPEFEYHRCDHKSPDDDNDDEDGGNPNTNNDTDNNKVYNEYNDQNVKVGNKEENVDISISVMNDNDQVNGMEHSNNDNNITRSHSNNLSEVLDSIEETIQNTVSMTEIPLDANKVAATNVSGDHPDQQHILVDGEQQEQSDKKEQQFFNGDVENQIDDSTCLQSQSSDVIVVNNDMNRKALNSDDNVQQQQEPLPSDRLHSSDDNNTIDNIGDDETQEEDKESNNVVEETKSKTTASCLDGGMQEEIDNVKNANRSDDNIAVKDENTTSMMTNVQDVEITTTTTTSSSTTITETTTTCTGCSICIEDFEEGEKLILLPRCKHAYHKDCIKQWLLERQGCCPLCKTNVLDSPTVDETTITDNTNNISSEQTLSSTITTGSVINRNSSYLARSNLAIRLRQQQEEIERRVVANSSTERVHEDERNGDSNASQMPVQQLSNNNSRSTRRVDQQRSNDNRRRMVVFSR